MLKILIVDDDYLVRAYLKEVIDWEAYGFEILEDVEDGENALEFLKGHEVDLMFTDISMPIMNGIELIKEVRKINDALRIVVLSCHDDFNYVKEALKNGADDYVLKNDLNDSDSDVFMAKIKLLFDESGQQVNNPQSGKRDFEEDTLMTGVTNMTVIQGIAYIKEHYKDSISLSDVSEHLGVNATYLSRIFKQETNMKFTDFMTKLRIEYAQELLKETNKKIKDISTECGFYEYRYFCNVFKKYTNLSPREFRKMNIMNDYNR